MWWRRHRGPRGRRLRWSATPSERRFSWMGTRTMAEGPLPLQIENYARFKPPFFSPAEREAHAVGRAVDDQCHEPVRFDGVYPFDTARDAVLDAGDRIDRTKDHARPDLHGRKTTDEER